MEDKNLQTVIDKLKNWAETKNQVLEIWIYGSRAKGTAREDSDLDIAYQISPLSTEDEKTEFWSCVLPKWKQEIQSFSPWPIHLEAKIIVNEYLHESGKKFTRPPINLLDTKS